MKTNELNDKNRDLKIENNHLKKENSRLLKFLEISKYIIITICEWVSKKLNLSFDKTINNIELENNIIIKPEKQLQKLEYQKEQELEFEE